MFNFYVNAYNFEKERTRFKKTNLRIHLEIETINHFNLLHGRTWWFPRHLVLLDPCDFWLLCEDTRSSEKRLWNMKKEDKLRDGGCVEFVKYISDEQWRYGKTNKKKLWDFAVFFSFLSIMVGKKRLGLLNATHHPSFLFYFLEKILKIFSNLKR